MFPYLKKQNRRKKKKRKCSKFFMQFLFVTANLFFNIQEEYHAEGKKKSPQQIIPHSLTLRAFSNRQHKWVWATVVTDFKHVFSKPLRYQKNGSGGHTLQICQVLIPSLSHTPLQFLAKAAHTYCISASAFLSTSNLCLKKQNHLTKSSLPLCQVHPSLATWPDHP